MPGETIETLEQCLLGAAQHTSRAMLRLDRLRTSPDAEDRGTYAELHEAISDLSGARILLACLSATLTRDDPEGTRHFAGS